MLLRRRNTVSNQAKKDTSVDEVEVKEEKQPEEKAPKRKPSAK